MGSKLDYKDNIENIVHMCKIRKNYVYGIEELNKLLNDENYKDYYYLCYFYIGRFYALLDNKNEAIKFFTLAIELYKFPTSELYLMAFL